VSRWGGNHGAHLIPPVDVPVAEILENERDTAGDAGDSCSHQDDRHDKQDRAKQEANGAGCDFVDLGCHTRIVRDRGRRNHWV
jgi:hypothetical protein